MDPVSRPVSTYDLHLHTSWSYDAVTSADVIFRRARELGMRCLAITEHHVLDSLPQVKRVAEGYPEIRVVPAAELSVDTSIGAIDLLCYGFPGKIPVALQQVLGNYHDWQREYGSAVSAGMQAIGIDYSDEKRRALLETYRPPEAMAVQGLTHVKGGVQRDYFLKAGYARDEAAYRELFERVSEKVDLPPYPAVEDVVPAIKSAGVLVAIAHPFSYFGGTDRDRMDALTEECQLDGIECAHLSVPVECTPIYRAYCEEKGLFSTAGTDCHSDEDVDRLLSCHGGQEAWLDEFLERLDA
jgi:predicted metal-dependent phosphoesterase TrpH